MNIVVAGSRVQIYGEDVQTYKTLPIGSYDVCFNKMTGFYLTPRHELSVKEEKIYGNHEKKVEKVLKSFSCADRNFGIILSGQKGIGKSLFARILANKATAAGLPIITVSNYIPGVSDFISSIEQEVVVIFDEFEKTFGKHEDFDPQEEMLSLFDGIDNGKKLFVITCNEVFRLNDFLLNRPGRFHYHFSLTNPSPDEVREYMTDKLDEKYYFNIDNIVNFSRMVNVTYDFLRAIAFELNQGYSLDESLADLNITRTDNIKYDITAIFDDGSIYKRDNECELDLYSNRTFNSRLNNHQKGDSIYCRFDPSKVRIIDGELTLLPEDASWEIDDDCGYYWRMDDEEREAAIERDSHKKLKAIIIKKVEQNYLTRYLV